MIISHMFGGLGNQLFQYAAGKRLAVTHSVPLAVDTSAFGDYKLRHFDLEYFNTSIRIATAGEINALRPSSVTAKALQYLRPKARRTYHRERSYAYDPSFDKIGPDVYLKGYFQCIPYFEPVAALLRQEFTLRPEYTSHLQPVAERLRQAGTVAVHIRRGDYGNPEVQKVLAMADEQYYRRAIAIIRQKISNPRFCFFSDDIDWVRTNLPVEGAEYISGEVTSSAIEDFYLLSCCANQVIPNSTFAWWSAFLNPNPDKTVIMPARWFNDESQNRDRTPAGWITT